MEKYGFYLIGKSFQEVLHKELLTVFYELINRKDTNEFARAQISKLTEPMEIESMKKLLIAKFQGCENFSISDTGAFCLEGSISGAKETMVLSERKITLEWEDGVSRFFDFLALYYPQLVGIDEIKGEIVELSLVKPLHIG